MTTTYAPTGLTLLAGPIAAREHLLAAHTLMPGLVAGLVVLLCLLFVALVVGVLNGVPKRDEGHLLPRDDEDDDEWWDGIR